MKISYQRWPCKYRLLEDYAHEIGVEGVRYSGAYLRLSPEGRLTVKAGYGWDGPSGPTFDTEDFMRGSLVHDALYQLMREGVLDRYQHREMADRLLRDICIEDGMAPGRAEYVYCAVRACGELSATPEHERPQAPTWPTGGTPE